MRWASEHIDIRGDDHEMKQVPTTFKLYGKFSVMGILI
jgi:hypothetical protein